MIRVLIVDDHALVRVALRNILSDAPNIKVIGQAKDGFEAIKLCKKRKPDVVLMDIQMPGLSGLEATLQIQQLNLNINVLIVTGYKNEVYLTRLLQIGASGYITKSAHPNELIHAIQIVSTGERYLTPEVASQLALKRFSNEVASPLEALSNRELDVARCIAEGESSEAIAKKLELSTKTVNSHRYRIFEKLKIKNDVALVHAAMRYGIMNVYRVPLKVVKK